MLLFFGRPRKEKKPAKNSRRDDEHPLKKRSGFGKIAGTAFWQKRSTVLNAKRCSAREEGVSFCRPVFGLILEWAVPGNLLNSGKIPCLLSCPHETNSTIASIPSAPKRN